MNTIGVSKKSTSLRLDSKLYAFIEELAKRENRSINNYIETLLFAAVGYNEPNDATKKSIEEAKKEKSSLKRYKDGNDFFAEIENEL